MKTIELQIPDGKRTEWIDGVLTLVDDKPAYVMERVTTYEDACLELGIEPVDDDELSKLGFTKDEIAYRKLKTISKALNEGWEPDWKNSYKGKYFAWFCYDKILARFKQTDSCNVCYVGSEYGSHLCFKNSVLASYAAKQFEDLYNDFFTIKD